MELLDPQNAERYLRETGRISAASRVTIRELTGGVSNMVLLVEHPDQPASNFVIKQARAQLRTRHVWLSSVERIWREAAVLRICQRLLAESREPVPLAIGTPQILFEDREQYLFGMTAAPQPNVVWKADLLAGHAAARIAEAAGRLLGTLHAGSWNNAMVAEEIGDRTLFDQLRVDPYYRTLAVERNETKPAVERLIASLAAHPRCLVHADFSPKNMLLFSGGALLVDFETGHYGDPAFDLGFFLSHLMLKAYLKAPRHAPYVALTEAFQTAYDTVLRATVPEGERADLWQRGVQNFAGCAWARLDGKSPVEYLCDEPRRETVRGLCREIFNTRPANWPEVLQLASIRLAKV
jgi:5-methylthioribose kinase